MFYCILGYMKIGLQLTLNATKSDLTFFPSLAQLIKKKRQQVVSSEIQILVLYLKKKIDLSGILHFEFNAEH